jgi:hypothetical protein
LIRNSSLLFGSEKEELTKVILKIAEENLKCLWSDGMGVCTSWRIAVTKAIEIYGG